MQKMAYKPARTWNQFATQSPVIATVQSWHYYLPPAT